MQCRERKVSALGLPPDPSQTYANKPLAGDDAYRWFDVQAKDAHTSVRIADAYSLLGTGEQLLRQKYKLDPEAPSLGDLVYDASLPGTVAARSLGSTQGLAGLDKPSGVANSSTARRRRDKRAGTWIESLDTELVED